MPAIRLLDLVDLAALSPAKQFFNRLLARIIHGVERNRRNLSIHFRLWDDDEKQSVHQPQRASVRFEPSNPFNRG
jgi:hypothetical protein